MGGPMWEVTVGSVIAVEWGMEVEVDTMIPKIAMILDMDMIPSTGKAVILVVVVVIVMT